MASGKILWAMLLAIAASQMLQSILPTTLDAAETPDRVAPAEPVDRDRTTAHVASIGGHAVRYVATAGTLLLPDDRQPTAEIFYIAYVAQGLGPAARRPITFAYNGGPGVSSALLDIGAFGPRIVVPADAETSQPLPHRIVDNEDSILDKTDLVFIDAVGTGYSRLLASGGRKEYYGIDRDARAFARFIRRYLDANDRGKSPKYLIGTSYGTMRSAVLVKMLQDAGIAIAGVSLMSTVLDFSKVAGTDDDRFWLYLPTEAAVAAYHHEADVPPEEAPKFLEEARAFAAGPFARALSQGDDLPDVAVARTAEQIHRFTGLPVDEIVRLHLRVPPDRFRKVLLHGRGEIIGRDDGRFVAPDSDPKSAEADADPSYDAVQGTLTSAFSRYVRDELHYTTKTAYVFTAPEITAGWDWSRGGDSRLGVDVSGDLAAAMTSDPSLRVLSVNGLYDLLTPFFATEYQLRHLGLPPAFRDHISFRYYPSGHLTYLNPVAHAALKNDLDAFYSATGRP